MAQTPEQYQAQLEYNAAKNQQALQQQQALNQLKQQAEMEKLFAGGSGGNEFDFGDSFGSSVQPTKIPLLDAFDQYTRQEALQNPWSIAANAVNKTALPKSDNFWETLSGNALQGLLGGGLRSFGEQDILGQFQEEIAPSLKDMYPELNLGGMKDLDSGRMQLITALGNSAQQDKLEQLGMKSGRGGKYGAGGGMSPQAIKLIADRAGISFEEAQALADVSPYQLQTMMYTLGANNKPLGDTGVKNITGGDNALYSIAQARKLSEDLSPGLLSALKAGKITDLYKDPESTAYKFYAQVDKLKKEVARMNDSGALTQLDVDMFEPLTSGSPVYDSKKAIQDRLVDLEQYIQNKRDKYLEASGKAGRNVSKFGPNIGLSSLEAALEDNPSSLAIPQETAALPTKVVGGVTYKRYPQGWKAVK